MKSHKYLVTMLGAALLSSAVPAAAVEKVDASTIELPAPAAGKGQVVFFRKGGLVGSAVNCTVFENGEKVSSMGGGRYFILVTEPGRHEFTVKSESKDSLAIEVEPDERQFVSCKIKMGIMVGRPDIRPATEAEFREATLGLVDADDMVAEGVLRPDQVEQLLAAGGTPEEIGESESTAAVEETGGGDAEESGSEAPEQEQDEAASGDHAEGDEAAPE